MRIRHEELVLSAALAAGSQGTIYRVERSRDLGFSFPLIYKEFSETTAVSGAALERMAAFRQEQADQDRLVLDQRTVWPCAVVAQGTRICGYVMQEIPDTFMQTIITMSGAGEPIAREVQHLFVSDAISRKNLGEVPKATERLMLAREMAFVLGFLHKRELVYGDLSYKNAVYTLRPAPMVMLLDCDAVRFRGQGAAVAQLNSPGWGAPEKGPQTIETDRYKLGLFVLRTLTPGVNAQNRDPAKASAVLDREGMALLERSLGGDPHDRPSGKDWVGYLDAHIAARGGVRPRTRPAEMPAAPPSVATRAVPPAARRGGSAATARVGVTRYVPPPVGGRGAATRAGSARTPVPAGRVPHRPAAITTTWHWPGGVAGPGGRGTPAKIGIPGTPIPGTYGAAGYAPARRISGWQLFVLGAWSLILVLFVVAVLVNSSTGGKAPARSGAATNTTGARPPGTARTEGGVIGGPIFQSAVDAATTATAAAGTGWTLQSVTSGDALGTASSLGNLTNPPPSWSFTFAQDHAPGATSWLTRTWVVTDGRAQTVREQTVTDPATTPPALPTGWASTMDRATASQAEALQASTGFPATRISWTCAPAATDANQCVWRFAIGSPNPSSVRYSSADGSAIVAPPAGIN